jgi:hypothetical protein
MIEVATGVVFLMSSLYGAGHANAQVANVVAAPTTGQATTTEVSTLTDPKDIEAYVRKHANKPILVEIARCESTFSQYDQNGQVMRGKVNRYDVGVMQINEKYHAEEALKLGYDIYTVEGNLAFAEHLYSKYGSDPWSASSKCWSHSADLAQK